jgi:hypothetical protein
MREIAKAFRPSRFPPRGMSVDLDDMVAAMQPGALGQSS